MGTFGAAVALHGLLVIGVLMAGMIILYLLNDPGEPPSGA